jgi:dihydrofolate reductase
MSRSSNKHLKPNKKRLEPTMRKITESTFVSLDGVTEDPRAWAMGYFHENAQQAALEQLQASDGMLMGRGTYEYFTAALPTDSPYADAINTIHKYVFSSTLETADWNNSTIIRDDPVTAVNELKQHDGRDLILYGHGRLSQTLLEHHLLDEIRFAVHPLLLTGRSAGHGNGQTPLLKLIAATPLPSGVVALAYQPDHG